MNAKKILDTVHNAAKEARYLIPQPARGVLDTLPNAGNNIAADLHDLICKASERLHDTRYNLRNRLHDFGNNCRKVLDQGNE